jgi:hypothetical protein
MMQATKGSARGAWPRWSLWLACLLALAAAAVFAVVTAAGGILSNLNDSGPAPSTGWIEAGILGQCLLAVTAVALLAAGLTRPSRRRAAVIIALAIIPAALAWCALSVHLGTGG